MANAADALKAIAPTIATALGGPLAGLAVEALGAAMGWTDATKEKVEKALSTGQMTGEQIAQVRAAEVALQQRLAELEIDLESVHQKDRQSARDMQIATRSIAPAVLATIVVSTWGFIQWHLLTHVIDQSMREIILRVLGTLDAALMMVLFYYFGSSRGSAHKTELLAKKDSQ